jgi:hypothetical protein
LLGARQSLIAVAKNPAAVSKRRNVRSLEDFRPAVQQVEPAFTFARIGCFVFTSRA